MKTVIGIIAAVVLVGAVGGFIVMNKDNETPSPNTSSTADQSSTDTTANQESPAAQSSESSTSNNVVMSDLAFSPAKITVKKGTTVTWTNNDDVSHDISPDNPTDEFKKSALFGKGGTYSVTFNTAGTFTYKCTPHPFMKGSVEVTE